MRVSRAMAAGTAVAVALEAHPLAEPEDSLAAAVVARAAAVMAGEAKRAASAEMAMGHTEAPAGGATVVAARPAAAPSAGPVEVVAAVREVALVVEETRVDSVAALVGAAREPAQSRARWRRAVGRGACRRRPFPCWWRRR